MAEQTFILTDVEGSTVLWERFPEQMSVALALHEEIIRSAVEARGGRIIRQRGEGDSLFAVFDKPAGAVAAAADLAKGLAQASWPSETPIRVRASVYTGSVEVRGGDYYGTTVNRAARTRELAFGGQVLLGQATAEAVMAQLPTGTALTDLGPRRLKDLSEPERVYELIVEGADALPAILTDETASDTSWIDRALASGFVDREEARDALRSAWAEGLAGHRRLVLIEGEAGIGKSTLAAAAADAARRDGGLVLYGHWDEEMLAPFQGFREALTSYARLCPRSILRADLRHNGREIARLFPETGARIGWDPAESSQAADADRLRLFDAISEWLGEIGARRPVLLVLDDLHWADQASVLLLRHLMRPSEIGGLMMVCTYRHAHASFDLSPQLLELARLPGAAKLSIGGLDRADARELVETATGFSIEDQSLLDDLHRGTGGNPLFLAGMARHLAGNGRLDAQSIRDRDLPETLRDLIRWRLRQLPEAAQAALAAAAVLGEEFDVDVIARVLEEDAGTVVDTLERSLGTGIVREVEGFAYRYAFSHGVVRRSLLEDLSGARRAHLHWRTADVLEERDPPANAAEIAYHLCAAVTRDRAGKAVAYAHEAGEKAMEVLAFEDSVRHLELALEVQEKHQPEDGLKRCELLLALGRAQHRAGDYEQRDSRYLAASRIARTIGEAELFVEAALGYGGALPAGPALDPVGQELLEEALVVLGDETSSQRALILGRLAHWLQLVPPRARRQSLADEAITIARSLDDPATLASVLIYRCWAMDGPGDLDEQLEAGAEIRKLGEQIGDREIVLRSLHIRTDALFEAGDMDGLRMCVREMRRIADELRYPEYTRIARSWDAVFATIEDAYEEAEEIAAEVQEAMRSMSHPQADLVHSGLTFPGRWLRGTAAEALPLYEMLAQAVSDRLVFPAMIAWLSAESDMAGRARAMLDDLDKEAIRDLDQNFLWWAAMVGLTTAAGLMRDREWAEVLYPLMLPYKDRNVSTGSSMFLGSAAHHLGVLASTLGRWDEALGLLEDALRRHRLMGSRGFAALTEQTLADALWRRGLPTDAERAQALSASALEKASKLGLGAVVHRAQLSSRGG